MHPPYNRKFPISMYRIVTEVEVPTANRSRGRQAEGSSAVVTSTEVAILLRKSQKQQIKK